MPGRDNPVSLEARGPVGPAGGVLGSKNGEITVALPAGAVNTPGTLSVRDRSHPRIAHKDGIGVTPLVAFDIELSDASDRKLPGQLGQEATITLDYSNIWLRNINPRSLTFFTLNETTNRWEPVKTEVDTKRRKVVVRTRHFSGWAAAGDKEGTLVPNMESVQTSTFTRSAEVSNDLKLPPGLSSILPKLTLRHSSNGINRLESRPGAPDETAQASWVGLGWSLDLGMVTIRAADTGHAMFSMSFGGVSDRILKKDSTGNQMGQYYLQNETFHKITHESSPKDHWLAISKDGTKFRFGYIEGADQNDSSSTNTGSCQDGVWMNGSDGNPHVFHYRWFLDQIEDTNGNIVTIEYEGTRVRADGQTWNSYYDRSVYPKEIRWNDRSGQPRFKIVFVRKDAPTFTREDIPQNSYMCETAILDSVDMFVNSSNPYSSSSWQQIRRYKFDITAQNFTFKPGFIRKHYLLNWVQEYDYEFAATLPRWDFTYTNKYLRFSDQLNIDVREVPFLTEVSNGYGGRTTFAYEVAATYLSDGDYHDTIRWYSVTTKTVYDGVSGGYQQRSYTGTNPYFYTAENWNRPAFRGFNVVSVTDALNTNIKEEHRFFQGTNGALRARSDGTNQTDSEGLVGREYETRWLDGANVLRKQWTEYHKYTWTGWMEELPPGETPDNTIYFSAPNDIRDFQGSRSKKQTIEYEDVYGNWISKKEYNDANATQWYRHTKQAFASSPNTGDWIVGKPRWVNVYEWDGTADGRWKSSTSYYYDGNSHLPPGTPTLTGNNEPVQKPGNLRAVRRARRESEYVNRYFDAFYDYDAYGNKIKETTCRGWGEDTIWGTDQVFTQWKDEDGNYGYDKVCRAFPKRIYNALNQLTTYNYDPKWGVSLTVTDPNNATVTTGYDVFGRPKRVWQPDDTVGTPASDADPAGASLLQIYVDGTPFKVETLLKKSGSSYYYLRTFYDGLGRLIQKYGDGVGGWKVANTHYSNRGLKEWESVPYFLTTDPGGSFNSTAWNDATKPRSQYGWDALRRPTTVTNPDGTQRSTNYSGLDVTLIDENIHKKVQKMDGFGRMVAVEEYTGTNPWYIYATTSYGYNVLDNLTSVTDALGNVTSITFNELSHKTQMTDPDMGIWSYGYDAVGNLISQTDAKGQAMAFTYDELNRMTRKYYPAAWVDDPLTTAHTPGVYDLMELRAAIDADRAAAGMNPDAAPWTNPAIVAGRDVTIRAVHFTEMRARIQDLWTQAGIGTVPEFTRGPIVAQTRLISKEDPADLRKWLYTTPGTNYEGSAWASQNGRRARAAYRYDDYAPGTSQYPNAKGRRTEMWDPSGHTVWRYDARGRIMAEERWIDGAYYRTEWSYDAMDRPVTMNYPDGEVVNYTYNAQLLLESMGGYVTGTNYNALGKPTQVVLGNGRVTDIQYCWLEWAGKVPYGAIAWIKTTKSGYPNLQDLQYTYDNVGNPTQVHDPRNGETINYGYDDLDRLTSASAPINGSYSHNEIGNLLSKGEGGATYNLDYSGPYVDGAPKHAPNKVNGVQYTYDRNGNLTNRSGVDCKYDAENRLVKVSQGSAYVARMAYNGDGRRGKRVDTYGTIHYVGPHYERNVGTGADTTEVVTKFYYAQLGPYRRLIALRRNGVLYYVHSDHLGGSNILSDTSGSEVGALRYHSYGQTRVQSGTVPTDKKFTGQTLDASSGLYHYGARYYDAALGRFVQPDSMVPQPGDPQSLNRYSYVLNNPLRYTDPSGHSYKAPPLTVTPMQPGHPPTGATPEPAPTPRLGPLDVSRSEPAGQQQGPMPEAVRLPLPPQLVGEHPTAPAQSGAGPDVLAGMSSVSGQGIYSALGLAAAFLSRDLTLFPRVGFAEGMLIFESDKGFAGAFLKLQDRKAMTLGRIVIATSHLTYAEVRHEAAHLSQVERLGPMYLAEYFRLYGEYGYWKNPMEKEAFEAAQRFRDEHPELADEPYPY